MTSKNGSRGIPRKEHNVQKKREGVPPDAPINEKDDAVMVRAKDNFVNTYIIAQRLLCEYQIERLSPRELARLILYYLPEDILPLEIPGAAWLLVFSLTKISRRQSRIIDELIKALADYPPFFAHDKRRAS